jgi:hypothetical protein
MPLRSVYLALSDRASLATQFFEVVNALKAGTQLKTGSVGDVAQEVLHLGYKMRDSVIR